MRKVDFYIIKVILKPFLTTLFILVGMIWLLQSIRLMDLVINKNMQILDFLQLSVLLIPSMLIILLPLSFFSGVYSGLKKMVADSEMDAIFAAGISRLRLACPLLILAFCMVVITYFISLYAMPAGRMQFSYVKQNVLNDSDSLQLQAGTFNKLDQNITVYVKEINDNKWLKNIIVYDNTKHDKPVTWTAEEGFLKIDEFNRPNLFLINGSRQEISQEQTSVLGFKSHQIDISREIKHKSHKVKKKSERFLLELLDTEHLTRKKDIDEFKAEFYKRLLWPLAPIALAIIPLFYIFKPEKQRFGITKEGLICIAVAILFVALQMLFNSRISSGAYVFIYFAIVLPLLVPLAYMYLLFKEYNK